MEETSTALPLLLLLLLLLLLALAFNLIWLGDGAAKNRKHRNSYGKGVLVKKLIYLLSSRFLGDALSHRAVSEELNFSGTMEGCGADGRFSLAQFVVGELWVDAIGELEGEDVGPWLPAPFIKVEMRLDPVAENY